MAVLAASRQQEQQKKRLILACIKRYFLAIVTAALACSTEIFSVLLPHGKVAARDYFLSESKRHLSTEVSRTLALLAGAKPSAR